MNLFSLYHDLSLSHHNFFFFFFLSTQSDEVKGKAISGQIVSVR